MNKIALTLGIAFIGFVIVLGVSIGSRLDQPTVTMLMGLMCGVGAALPIGLAVGLYFGDRRRRDHESPPQPIVIMSQPPASTSNSVPQLQAPYLSPQPRSFSIIGDEGSKD
jgi:hypothetical protein